MGAASDGRVQRDPAGLPRRLPAGGGRAKNVSVCAAVRPLHRENYKHKLAVRRRRDRQRPDGVYDVFDRGASF